MNKANHTSNRYPCMISEKLSNGLCHRDRTVITSIRVVDSFKPSDGDEVFYWDISAWHDGSVKAYLPNNTTELVIAGNGNKKIQVGSSMHKMFAGFTALKRIEGLELLDTGNVTDMSYLFYHCISLKDLDLSTWNVSNVRTFRGTFCCGCNQIGNARLERVNLSGWDVSRAEDMAYMFYGCGMLKHIDVSNWNTGNVTNFRHTFADCFQLREIDVGRWNTKSAITLDGIFNDCRSLKQIDISGWDTSSCLEFDQMFDNCIHLKKINGIEKLDTSNGISFEEMFFGCRSLETLDLSSINTKNVDGHEFTAYHSSIHAVSSMKKMLVGCNTLKKLVIGTELVFFYQPVENSIILNKLKEVGYLVLSPETGSMKPLLRAKRDQAVFHRQDSYHKGDIVLYRRENDSKLIMHRIERSIADGFVIRGDCAYYSEYVPAENIFAAATEIHRGNKIIKTDSNQYKIFSLWSVCYNSLMFTYRKSNHIFWKAARNIRGILSNGGRKVRP